MWGFEHYGMGWGMVLVWLIPILLVAGIVYALRGRTAHPGERHWTSWKPAMPGVKSIGKRF